jgi:hypothetical protein
MDLLDLVGDHHHEARDLVAGDGCPVKWRPGDVTRSGHARCGNRPPSVVSRSPIGSHPPRVTSTLANIHGPADRCRFRTAIDHRDNGGVLLNVSYRHSGIKKYLEDCRAMRIGGAV